MAPGLSGRQTGTVPKNKLRSESQSHRLTCEPFVQSSSSEWEHMSELGREKNYSKKKSCTSRSETDADFLRQELGRSRSSTMTSQNGNGEGCSHNGFPAKIIVPDRKQVANKLCQIQNYVQQTAALLSSLRGSDTPGSESQYKKLSAMLEELRDSERKLSGLLDKMDSTESRIDSLLQDANKLQGNNNNNNNNNNNEAEEEEEEEEDEDEEEAAAAAAEELAKRSRESKRKLEVLQKKKQDLLKLQEKAKKQLEEAQAEQSRLLARASGLNHELSSGKVMDLNVQQLCQRLKAVQEIYSTRNQITDNLNENQKISRAKGKRPEDDQAEVSDTETDFQLVSDKMEELDAMKAQLGQIQKIMASLSTIQNSDTSSNANYTGDDIKEQINQNSSCNEGEQSRGDGNNNLMKLEEAKSKLNHLTQLLEIVQSAQNTNGLSPSYLQLVSNLVNEEADSCPDSLTPPSSVKSPQRNCGEISVQTMQVMTRELEETTAAMKEERDRLLAARQELQDIAKRLPINKSEAESVSPDFDSESEPACLKPTILDSSSRDELNGLTEADQSSKCNENSPYAIRPSQSRSRQRGMWNLCSPGSNCTTQERRSKKESVSRGSTQSSRGGSRVMGRDQSHWSPSPSVSFCNDRPSALKESQQQLEMSGNLCEMTSESLQRGLRPSEILLQEMFGQHQLLTRTVAQCSQLLWLQQRQIIELRNAIMLQFGLYPNQQLPPIVPNQSNLSVPVMGNPSFLSGPLLSNVRQVPSFTLQQQQHFLHPLHQNVKLNGGDMQNIHTSQQDFPEQFLDPGNQASLHFPDGFGCDLRSGNFNRFNPSSSNTNHNFHQNLSSGFNNRGPNGINSLVPEDSGALNNQVPPGNRANNYWDNFRSYSRQNLLSNTKSNEDSESSRRCLGALSHERSPRDPTQASLYNNQSVPVGGTPQQPPFSYGNCETASNDQFLLPPNQNTRTGHHGQTSRTSSVEPTIQRSSGKNETRHQDNDSRNLHASAKNEGSRGGRSRNPDSSADIRSVRNDVSHGCRNTDNLNSTRNFVQLVRDIDNEEVAHENNNKKREERARYQNEGLGTLNNRGYHNTSLWDSIYAEVSTFIRANESRPHFLLQLFRDLQQVNTDSLRQRALVSIQETFSANNLTERTSNVNGGNVNIIENRNNIRENRSNLNRNLTEDPDRIDELFYHLRENQNTIRQNIGMSSYILNGNLENPNISNIRDLVNSRNNLENEGLRDLRTYFEANLCNFGHNSALENPNLSNIRENLTRRVSGISDWDNIHPKNVYLSIYDNVVEPRRRDPYRNLELENDYLGNDVSGNCENVNIRESNNHFEPENNFEGAVGTRAHFQQENRPTTSRFPDLGPGENFGRSRQFLSRNGNDSGIDINFNNEEKKRGSVEGEACANDGNIKSKKNGEHSLDEIFPNRGKAGGGEVEGAAASLLLRSEWERNGREETFDSSLKITRKEVSPFIPICENSFFHCRAFQQTDNGDLAEADQSRNEETSGAESDSGFINAQIVDSGIHFSPDRNLHSTENNFSSQNIPEAERNFMEVKNTENDCNIIAEEPERALNFSNSSSKTEGGLTRLSDGGETHRKNEALDGFFYQVNASSSSETNSMAKSGMVYRKRPDETAEREASSDLKKSSCKNSTNKFRDSSFSQGKYSGAGGEESESRKTDTDSVGSTAEGRQQSDSRDSLFYGAFQLALDKSIEAEKGNTSPEVDSDWECGSGLDQVPTRLNKSGSSRKSEDSNGSVP